MQAISFTEPESCFSCGRMLRSLLLASLLSAAAVRALAADPILTVISPEKTLVLGAAEFGKLPRTEFVATDPHEKGQHHYSGVAVRDLLAQVGAQFGEKLRGKALQLAVLIRSSDGYATLFALAEFDDAFNSRTIIVADSVDGAPLAGKYGPLRLIIPGDKRAGRWARMVNSIEIVQPGAAGAKPQP